MSLRKISNLPHPEEPASFEVKTLFPNFELLTISLANSIGLTKISGSLNKATESMKQFLESYCPSKKEFHSLLSTVGLSPCMNCLDFLKNPDLFSMIFGTQDIITSIPMPNSLAISMCRKKLAYNANVASVFGFPASLVHLPDVTKMEFRSEPKVPRFIAYSFIHRPMRIPGPANEAEKRKIDPLKMEFFNEFGPNAPGVRTRYLQDMVKYYNDFLPDFYRDSELRRGLNQPQLYLTLATAYRFVVMSEHKEISDLTRFLLRMERHLPVGKQISTFITWYDQYWTEPLKVAEKGQTVRNPFGENVSEEVTFRILVKCRGTLWERATGEKLDDTLSEFSNQVPVSIQDIFDERGFTLLSFSAQDKTEYTWFPRPYFWDFFVFVRTKRVNRLLQKIVDWQKSHPDVVDIVTMPILSIDPKTRDMEKISLKRYRDQEDYLKEFNEVYKKHLETSLAELEEHQEGYSKLFFKKNRANKIVDPTFFMVWNNLKEEIGYSQNCLSQLKNNWYHLIHLRGLDSIRNRHPKTFKRMSESLNDMRDQMNDVESNNNYWASEKIDKEAKKTVQKVFYKLNEVIGSMRKIAAEFNDKAESLQAVSSAEHLVKVAETSGVLDMVAEAAGRTFWCYSFQPTRSNPLTWHNAGDPSKFKWDGIVCSSSEDDFKINLNWQILFLPANIKSLGYDDFIIISHEAAHNALAGINLEQGRSTTPKSAFDEFKAEVWDDYWKGIEEKVKDLDQAGTSVLTEKEFLLSYQIPKMKTEPLPHFEFMADILALLSAGPAYLHAIMVHGFAREGGMEAENIFRTYQLGSGLRNSHAPLWLRATILYRICEMCGWLKEDDFSIRQTFQDRIQPLLERVIESSKLLQGLFGVHSSDTVYDFTINCFNVIIHSIISNERYGVGCIWPEHFFLLFLSSENGDQWLTKLIRWLNSHDESFLFYPLEMATLEQTPVTPEPLVSIDEDNLRKCREQLSKINLRDMAGDDPYSGQKGNPVEIKYLKRKINQHQKETMEKADKEIEKQEKKSKTRSVASPSFDPLQNVIPLRPSYRREEPIELFDPNIVRAINRYCRYLAEKMTGDQPTTHPNLGTLLLDAPIKYILAGSYYLSPTHLPNYINRFRAIHSIYYCEGNPGYRKFREMLRRFL